ncbi:MAG: hypothetical protein ACMUHY_04855 [Thermoplasmatota archaeon]
MARKVRAFTFIVGRGFSADRIKGPLDILGSLGSPVLIDIDSVYSPLHLSSGLMHAARAIYNDEARAREPSIEVLRWLSGSHQVSQGIDISGPSQVTGRLLAVILPDDWPAREDTVSLPEIREETWEGEQIEGLGPVDPPFRYGEGEALKKLGIDIKDGSIDEEERAVLENLCLTDLK